MKVQISRSATGKKYTHDLTHDISTTTGIGHVQPILCRECPAQDTVSLRFGTQVRLNPLVKPTFGTFKVKTYSSFVKIEDIYHPFASLLSGQSYNGSEVQYIPEYVPFIALRDLNGFCMAMSEIYTFVTSTGSISDGNITVAGATPVRFSVIGAEAQSAILSSFAENAMCFDSSIYVGLSNLIQNRFGRVLAEGESYPLYKYDSNLSFSDIENFDWVYPVHTGGKYYLMCGRFTNFAKNLRKVLIGLGYKLSFSHQNVSILPLFAYYKAYFDLFIPQRDITWKDTSAFQFMEYLEQNGLYDVSDILISDPNSTHWDNFVNFIVDLATCYYTINPDYASAHIAGMSTDTATQSNPTFSYNNLYGTGFDDVSTDQNSQVYFEGNLSRSGLRVLNELSKLVNKATAIGGNIGAYMRSVFNSDYNDEVDSQLLGSSSFNFDPSPVFSTNESSDVALGEFAGQGYGQNAGTDGQIKFTCKSQGYLISMLCIVPECKMSQGVDPNLLHLTRFEFYHEDFDALTLLPTKKLCIYGNQEYFNNSEPHFAGGFGNIPNYTEYKVKDNILNGDMSLASTRASYAPFTLDKLLPYKMTSISGNVLTIKSVPADLITAGTFWRYIGRDRAFGNFDRIFIQSYRQLDDRISNDFFNIDDDNIIVQMVADFKVTGYELPLSMSFDTGAIEGGDQMSVKKS